MKMERLQEIIEDVKRTTIPLPATDSLSYLDIKNVLLLCDQFIMKLQAYDIELMNDIDSLKRVIGAKKDAYDILLQEKIMTDTSIVVLNTDGAKVRQAKYLLRKEAEELRLLNAELSESESVDAMLARQQRDTVQKINMAKKLWTMHEAHLKAFGSGGTGDTKPVVFSDPFVETLVKATADGTDESTDNKLGAEVDFQKNRTPEAPAGSLYKVEPAAPIQSDDGEKSKAENGAASIISEEGSDVSDIIASL